MSFQAISEEHIDLIIVIINRDHQPTKFLSTNRHISESILGEVRLSDVYEVNYDLKSLPSLKRQLLTELIYHAGAFCHSPQRSIPTQSVLRSMIQASAKMVTHSDLHERALCGASRRSPNTKLRLSTDIFVIDCKICIRILTNFRK